MRVEGDRLHGPSSAMAEPFSHYTKPNAFFADRTEDLNALSLEEFTYWPTATRRRV